MEILKNISDLLEPINNILRPITVILMIILIRKLDKKIKPLYLNKSKRGLKLDNVILMSKL